MVKAKIGKHTVEIYDAIDELPIVRFHRYQKLLLIDAGVGSDIAAFDQRTEKMRRYLMDGKTENAQKELENLVGCYIHLEGYTDLKSIYDILRQEYPGEFDRNLALFTIHKVLKEERD